MGKSNIPVGSKTVEDYFWWINERTRIYLKKEAGEQFPWTKDPILQKYKFTNAYRQLDRGTVALLEMIKDKPKDKWLVFNIMWYRLFNLEDHAREFGYIHDELEVKLFKRYIEDLWYKDKKIFTGAHMTTGVFGEKKWVSYLRACDDAYVRMTHINMLLTHGESMKSVYEYLLGSYMVGSFVAYEMVCDFRFAYSMSHVNEWANLGPGAKRGLTWLGMPRDKKTGIESMKVLFAKRSKYLDQCHDKINVPFELREIEHSLCEWDKWCRATTGIGRPRSRYRATTK